MALVDSAVIRDLYSDFLGVNGVALPTLCELFTSRNIALWDCKTMHQMVSSW
ncbi:MAG: hypothetical protein J1F68_06250 [Clostridiales bacterium]|nr:hypothetical protein [Clostridiales bacterium]